MRISVMVAMACFSVIGLSVADESQAAVKKQISIPAQGLGPALKYLAWELGFQIVYVSEEINHLRTGGAIGEMTASEALESVLGGTGLTYRYLDEKTVTVVPLPGPAGGANRSTRAGQEAALWEGDGHGTEGSTRLAQAQNPTEESKSADASRSDTENNSQNSGENATKEQEKAFVARLEEIVVTGTNIRGVPETHFPSIAVTRSDFEKQSFETLEGVFASIPQNFAGVAPGTGLVEGGSGLAGQNFFDNATGVDLRGLGVQATLTLLNGSRRAGNVGGRVFDISTIPLSIVERVEIVSGGRSAIYGADAVAGVVNIITREKFDGAETQASYGFTTDDRGGERLQVSQILGASSSRGGFVAAYDYTEEDALDVVDADLTNPEALAGRPVSLNVQPNSTRHSAFVAGQIDVTEGVEIFGDANYSSRDTNRINLTTQLGAVGQSFDNLETENNNYGAALGVRIDVASEWLATVSAAHSVSDGDAVQDGLLEFDVFSIPYSALQSERSLVTQVTGILEGPVPKIGGIAPRIAVGTDFRTEEFDRTTANASIGDDRNVRSLFVEILLPLKGDQPGERQLDVTLAGRLDDYSDFGSSFNPQFGVSWEAAQGVVLRSSYATAFRAPALVESNEPNFALLEAFNDPSGGGVIPALTLFGGNDDLTAEEADTWSIGLEWDPPSLPGLRTSISYFSVAFDDRVETPALPDDRLASLSSPDDYPDILNGNPSAEDVQVFVDRAGTSIFNVSGLPFDPATQDFLTAFPNLVLFDNRSTNIATERFQAVDAQLNSSLSMRNGTIELGLNAIYTLEHKRRITSSAGDIRLIDGVGKPAAFRARASLGLSRNHIGVYAYVNYVSDYPDNFSTPSRQMDAWTTIDLTLNFDNRPRHDKPSKGVFAALSVQNLLDDKPPSYLNGNLSGLLFDAANSNALGRFVAFRIGKTW